MKLRDVKGVGYAVEEKLNSLGIITPLDLVNYLPSKYIDLQSPESVSTADIGHFSLFSGEVNAISSISGRKVRSFRLTLRDLKNPKFVFAVVFYNQTYLYESFKVGEKYRFLGKVQDVAGVSTLINPLHEEEGNVKKLVDGIFTVYPLHGVIGQNTFKNIVSATLDAFEHLPSTDFTLFDAYTKNVKETDFLTGVRSAHFPQSLNDAEEGQKRLAIEDMANAVAFYKTFAQSGQNLRKVFYKTPNSRIIDYISALDFVPTPSQNDAFEAIVADLKSNHVMHRLVNGDVGSGKTAVAFFALYCAAASGLQSAMMAPTEILAYQHFAKFQNIGKRLGITSAVLTSSTPTNERKDILIGLANGTIQVVFGTQSLLNSKIEYHNLALTVADEQHKFGVAQRKHLEESGTGDLLSMSATPIPRTVFLTFYDDIAVSRIYKREEAASNIITKIVPEAKKADMFAYIANECKGGKQAFVVCPSIFDSEGFDLNSTETTYKETTKTAFKGLKVALLHGKLSSDDKNAIMNDFANGKTDILISTTVIEVGVDTKASLLAVLDADRFGLASLHQLRGRIGRDGAQSFCFLHTAREDGVGEERLKALTQTSDGLELAEKDFEMRGAGEFLGTRQCGSQSTPKYSLPISLDVLSRAKALATVAVENQTREFVALLTARAANYDDFVNKLFDTTLSG